MHHIADPKKARDIVNTHCACHYQDFQLNVVLPAKSGEGASMGRHTAMYRLPAIHVRNERCKLNVFSGWDCNFI